MNDQAADEWFDPAFLAAIGRLSLAIRPAPPRAAVGAHLAPTRSGASLEFRDYQAYAPGDDLRRVDWAVYGRTRHLFVRRFERPTAVPVTLLVDASASMMLDAPSRFRTAARVAAATASAALNAQCPLRLLIAGDAATRAIHGRRGFARALADLSAVRAPRDVGIAAGLRAALPALAAVGTGVVFVISDFLEADGVDAILEPLRRIPGRLAFVRVTRPEDERPDLAGDYELVDCEHDARRQTIVADASALARYRTAYRAYFGALDAYAAARGAPSVAIDATSATVPQLAQLFPAGVMTL